MNFSSIIAACLLIIVTIHELNYWKKVFIKANKSKLEILALFSGITIISIASFAFAGCFLHYLMFFCGILFIVADVWKKGLSKEGLLIIARGKELYKWTELSHAEISVSDTIKIVYYVRLNTIIETQFYPIDAYEKIVALFQEYNVSYKINK